MAYIITFQDTRRERVIINKDVRGIILGGDVTIVKYEDESKDDDTFRDVHSIIPYYYHDGE